MKLDIIKKHLAKNDFSTYSIKSFLDQYERYILNKSSYILEKDIYSLSRASKIIDIKEKESPSSLSKVAAIKLNGGLGTSMGLSAPKSSLIVKEGLSFFDIVLKQVKAFRDNENQEVPLIFMNSFSTQSWTERALATKKKTLVEQGKIPRYFIQNKSPKIEVSTDLPISWPKNPELEWCPPGHGDIYSCLVQSGLIDLLINQGIGYVFISNIDNLQATVDSSILAYIEDKNIDFLMEVCRRNPTDKKGGHLALTKDKRIILRERAQCKEDELSSFEDIDKHKYFNTNNLWIRLSALKDAISKNNGILPLDLIANYKTVDASDKESPEIVQLETAMGSAIKHFKNSSCIEVGRDRFLPVKNTNELLLLRSDLFSLNNEYRLIHHDSSWKLPEINLDPQYYKSMASFDKRFLNGSPSLKHCSSLKVKGDVTFPENFIIKGDKQYINSGDNPLILSTE